MVGSEFLLGEGGQGMGDSCGPSLQVQPHTTGMEVRWRKGHRLGLLRLTSRDIFQGGYIPLGLKKFAPGGSVLSNRKGKRSREGKGQE